MWQCIIVAFLIVISDWVLMSVYLYLYLQCLQCVQCLVITNFYIYMFYLFLLIVYMVTCTKISSKLRNKDMCQCQCQCQNEIQFVALIMHSVDLCLNLIRFEWVVTSLWRHLSFLQTIVYISNSIEPTDFILGTKVQPNKAHSMTQVPMT